MERNRIENPQQENLAGQSDVEENGHVNEQDQTDKISCRWMSRSCPSECALETGFTADSSVDDTST